MVQETIQQEDKDSPVVESLKSESKREFDDLVRLDDQFRFNAGKMAKGFSSGGNPELWCLWYSKLLSDFFEGLDSLLYAPISREDETVEDGVEHFLDGFDYLAERASKRTESDTTPLITNRNKIQKFKEGDSDKVTLLIEIIGGQCSLNCLNEFITDQSVVFSTEGSSADGADEASLREHSTEISEFFNGYSPYRRRPQEKYKRMLSVSVKRCGESYEITVGVDESRARGYSVWEKMLRYLGQDFTADSYTDFIRDS